MQVRILTVERASPTLRPIPVHVRRYQGIEREFSRTRIDEIQKVNGDSDLSQDDLYGARKAELIVSANCAFYHSSVKIFRRIPNGPAGMRRGSLGRGLVINAYFGETGQRIRSKVDSHFGRKWTPVSVESGQQVGAKRRWSFFVNVVSWSGAQELFCARRQLEFPIGLGCRRCFVLSPWVGGSGD